MDGTHSGETLYLCHSCSHTLSQLRFWYRLDRQPVERTLTQVAITTAAATITTTKIMTTAIIIIIIIVTKLGMYGECNVFNQTETKDHCSD